MKKEQNSFDDKITLSFSVDGNLKSNEEKDNENKNESLLKEISDEIKRIFITS